MTDPPPAPIQLSTARLLLRPPRLDDADAYYAIASDPEHALYGSHNTLDRAAVERGLARIVATAWDRRPELAIVLAGQVVGRVALEIDRVNLTGALGYAVARPLRGRGIASEAARAVVDYGFTVFGLAKVWARADPRNGASVRVLEKLGMQREGLLRRHVMAGGERADRVYYGILREEWEAHRGD